MAPRPRDGLFDFFNHLSDMGRTKPKKKHLSKVQQGPASNAKEEPSISALLEKTQSLIVQCDYELASRFARRVLERDSSNVEAKEMLGVALLETGEIEQAKQVNFYLKLPGRPNSLVEAIRHFNP